MNRLSTVAFLGDRGGIRRVLDLVTDTIADRAIIHIPRPMGGLASVLAGKPTAIVLATDDAAFAREVLRAVKAQMGADFAVFVFTARPGAFNEGLTEFPNAKFVDNTGMEPLPNWFTRGQLAGKLLETISGQEQS